MKKLKLIHKFKKKKEKNSKAQIFVNHFSSTVKQKQNIENINLSICTHHS